MWLAHLEGREKGAPHCAEATGGLSENGLSQNVSSNCINDSSDPVWFLQCCDPIRSPSTMRLRMVAAAQCSIFMPDGPATAPRREKRQITLLPSARSAPSNACLGEEILANLDQPQRLLDSLGVRIGLLTTPSPSIAICHVICALPAQPKQLAPRSIVKHVEPLGELFLAQHASPWTRKEEKTKI